MVPDTNRRKLSAVVGAIDTDAYETQLTEKQQGIRERFAKFNPPTLEVFRSRPEHYRMRSEFTVWHDKEDIYYVMFEKDESSGEHRRVRVDQFPVASELVNQLMKIIMDEIRSVPVLRNKLFQANFHTTLSGQSMVTLIYHRKLDEEWENEAKRLREKLAHAPNAATVPHVIGRSRKQRILLDAAQVEEELDVPGRGILRYAQVEGAFSQPNAGVCCAMLGWAVDVSQGSGSHDLLELYCGNGNFTAAVAPNFRRVVATELSKSSVAAARSNFAANGVTNVFVARMSSEEFTEAWRSGRQYNRLQGAHLESCEFKTLLVDPPRAGLDERTVELLRDFERVIYISCNPETLERDIKAVATDFDMKRFAMFDQFPYSHHVECGVYLVKRTLGNEVRGVKRKAEDGLMIGEVKQNPALHV